MKNGDSLPGSLKKESAIKGIVPPLALLIVTVCSLAIYAWVKWPYHWQSRLMHPVLFSLWTVAWHTTARGSFAMRIGCRMKLLPTLMIPPIAALVGEAMQFVWVAVGHEPEWAGACFSLLGVAMGWGVLGAWTFLDPTPRSIDAITFKDR